jgi:hypothetical protein
MKKNSDSRNVLDRSKKNPMFSIQQFNYGNFNLLSRGTKDSPLWYQSLKLGNQGKKGAKGKIEEPQRACGEREVVSSKQKRVSLRTGAG